VLALKKDPAPSRCGSREKKNNQKNLRDPLLQAKEGERRTNGPKKPGINCPGGVKRENDGHTSRDGQRKQVQRVTPRPFLQNLTKKGSERKKRKKRKINGGGMYFAILKRKPQEKKPSK